MISLKGTYYINKFAIFLHEEGQFLPTLDSQDDNYKPKVVSMAGPDDWNLTEPEEYPVLFEEFSVTSRKTPKFSPEFSSSIRISGSSERFAFAI